MALGPRPEDCLLNRKNLTAAVLAGFISCVGLAGTAQASDISANTDGAVPESTLFIAAFDDQMVKEVPDIVVGDIVGNEAEASNTRYVAHVNAHNRLLIASHAKEVTGLGRDIASGLAHNAAMVDVDTYDVMRM